MKCYHVVGIYLQQNTMNTTPTKQTNETLSWDKFWQSSNHSQAFSDHGVNHPTIQTYWQNFFLQISEEGKDTIKLLDLACGNGALFDIANTVPSASKQIVFTGIDSSKAATDNLLVKHPKARVINSPLSTLPFDDNSFDVVTSQFGLEYAGLDNIDEAIRVLADGGSLRLLVHFKGGTIAGECQRNLNTLTVLRDSNFIALARDLFHTGAQAAQGKNRAEYDAAGSALAATLPKIEHTIQHAGDLPAVDMLEHLYLTVGKIHNNLTQYDPQEVQSWLSDVEAENLAYQGRMESMLNAAIDEDEFAALCAKVTNKGLSVTQAGPLLPHDSNRSLAWALTAKK